VRSPVGELLSAAGRVLSRPRNDAAVPYVGRSGGSFAGGGMATGDQTSAIEAPGSNGTLFAIINQLSTGTAALDWHMHKTGLAKTVTCDVCGSAEDAPHGVQLIDTHPALSVWNKPNDFFTPMLFVESFQQHLDLVGEAWWVVVYLGNRPIELWPVRPDRMAPVRDAKKFISGYVYRAPDGQLIPLRLDEVVMLRTPAPWDPYRGAGAVQTLMSQLYGAKYASEWNRRFFENSAIPGGVVEMPVHLQDPEWEEFQMRWSESHRGVRNAHTVAVLEHGAKWIDTKYTQKDMEFSELRRATREEIREAFAIHGQVLGISENVNRANAEAGEYGWAKRHMVPRGERIKDALNGPFLKLFKGFDKGYAFAYANPVPEDREGDNAERLSKAQAFAAYISAGVDEADAAQVCGLPPLKIKPKPKPDPALAPQPVGAPAGGPDDNLA
jgi:HK97 family phage portal protein